MPLPAKHLPATAEGWVRPVNRSEQAASLLISPILAMRLNPGALWRDKSLCEGIDLHPVSPTISESKASWVTGICGKE